MNKPKGLPCIIKLSKNHTDHEKGSIAIVMSRPIEADFARYVHDLRASHRKLSTVLKILEDTEYFTSPQGKLIFNQAQESLSPLPEAADFFQDLYSIIKND